MPTAAPTFARPGAKRTLYLASTLTVVAAAVVAPALPAMRRHSIRLESTPLTPESLAAQDCVLICTDHSAYDWPWIVAHSALVIDTRNATRGVVDGRDRIVLA